MKNWKKVIGVASAAAMTAAMMMPASVFAADDETFKIGVIGPMTGDYAQYGTNVYNAAKIAADEINENGGFNGYKVEILDAGDDQGDPEKAVNAYNDLIDKGMQMLCGTVTSGSCIAVGAEAAEDTFLFTPSATALDCITAGTNEFRKLVEEIGILMGYEALRDLPTEEVEIETPIETCKTPMISGKKLAVIPVLRAGLGMVNSILTLVPSAKVGHVGLYRDPVTHEPHEYYCKLPESIDERISVIVDPMLATGGSAEAAVDYVKKQGGRNIKFMCIIAAPEGLKRLHEAHPDIQIYCGHLDRCLNEHAYICPGLGDAGDRIFGTK